MVPGCRSRLGVVVSASVAAACAVATPAGAAPAESPVSKHQPRRGQPEREHASVRLVSAETALRPGETNFLGLLFTIDAGWHIYWDGVNESGIPPRAEWDAPAGAEVGPFILPVPTRYVGPGDLLDHVYEDEVLLIVPVEVPADASPGSLLTFRAGVEWLVCKEMCLPGYADVMITLPVARVGEAPRASAFEGAFEHAWAHVPVAWEGQDDRLSIHITRSAVEIDASGARRVSYYPQSEAARAEDLLRRGVGADGRVRVRLNPRDRGAVDRDPVVRFVVEASFPGEESPVIFLVEKPLSELGG